MSHVLKSDAERFLSIWMNGIRAEEWLELRPLHRRTDGIRPRARSWHRTLDTALAAAADALANGDDVYLGAEPRARRGGRASDLGELRWLFADLDVGTEGHAQPAVHSSREAALARLASLGLAPQLLVDSGGGLHGWWRLLHPPTAAQWSDAIARLVHAVGGDPAVSDSPRILRLPGTLNFKHTPPRPVRLLEARDGSHPIEAFLALPSPPSAPAATSSRGGRRAGSDGVFTRANDTPIADVLARLGVEAHREGDRLYAACPVHRGSNPRQMVVGGQRNVATCFGDCAGKAYTPIDVTVAVRGSSALEAARWLTGDAAPGSRSPASARTGAPANDAGARSSKKRLTFGALCTHLRESEPYASQLELNAMELSPVLEDKPVDDARFGHIREHIEQTTGLSPAVDDLWLAIGTLASERRVHPVERYLRGLRWDGVERVPTAASALLGADDALSATLLRAWFISAVARPLSPGYKVDTALVLVGPQGIGKSTFFSVLAGAWFVDTAIEMGKKDAFQQLASAWIYEWAELEHLTSRRHEAEVKAFLTTPVDTFRPPFMRTVVKQPRSSVIVGTTNEPRFLTDLSGSRRFWVIATQRVDVAQTRALRDQLWAEAVARYDAGERHWLAEHDDVARELAAEAFMQGDPWQPLITGYVNARGPRPFTIAELLGDGGLGLRADQMTRAAEMRAAGILRKLGLDRVVSRDGDRRLRVWARVTSAAA
jgi:hypothetical protein